MPLLPPELDALMAWLHEHGARFPGAAPRRVPGRGIGLVATRALAAKDEVLFVPRTLWLTRKTKHATVGPLVELAHQRGLFAHTMGRLAFLLALESLRPDTFFRTYFDALREPTLPFALAEDEREALQGLRFARWVDTQGAELREEWAKLAALVQEAAPGSPEADAFTCEVYAWAYGHVIERSFTVDHEDEEVWVMVPGMDLCNHDAAEAKGYYTQDEGWFLQTTHATDEGAPVCISYGGHKTSRHFLLYYGFVPGDNPNDTLTLRIRVPEEDPEVDARTTLIEGLGLDTTCRVSREGGVPRTFLNALLIASMDVASFRRAASPDAPAPNWSDPAHTARCLTVVAESVDARLAAFATSLADDEAALAHGRVAPHLDRYVRYRVACKTLMRDVRDRVSEEAVHPAAPDAEPASPSPEAEETFTALEVIDLSW